MKLTWVLKQLTVFCPLCTCHIKVCSCFSRSGQPLLESAVKVDGAKLQLLSLTSGLNGLYQCEASNPHGSKHSQLYVHVGSGEVSLSLTVQFVQIFLDLFLTNWTDVVPFWCYSVFWCYPSTNLYKYILEHLKFE